MDLIRQRLSVLIENYSDDLKFSEDVEKKETDD